MGRIGNKTEVIEETEVMEVDVKNRQLVVQDEKHKELSSHEADASKTSENTMRLWQGEYKDADTVIRKAIDNLHNLRKREEINEFFYLDNQGNRHDDLHYCGIKRSLLPSDYRGRWNLKEKIELEGKTTYKLRKFLLVEIVLLNNHSIYLLEIEKKAKSDAFSGILFATEDILTESTIKNLLQTIVLNYGNYTKQISSKNKTKVPVSLPVKEYTAFRHIPSKNLLLREINKAVNIGLFNKS